MLYIDIIFIIIFSLYLYWLWGLLRALKSDAPYVPIGNETLEKMIDMVQTKAGALWVDLGSGDGRVLIAACKKYRVQGLGVERIAPLRLYSRLKIFLAGESRRIKIQSGDFFSYDLSTADIVSFYLLPETAERLFTKLQKELKPGAQLIFHRYPIPGLVLMQENILNKLYLATAPLKRNAV